MRVLERLRDIHQPLARVVTVWGRHPIACGCALVSILIVGANPYLLHHRGYLFGDAVNNWLSAFRWYGAAGREGVFGDFFPYAFSGFSHGWSPELGLYNPLYHLCAVAFPDSPYSVKLCYLILLNGIWALSFQSARDLGLSKASAFYVGLAVIASGFVVGHAQHLSYLGSAAALLAVLVGLGAAGRGQHIKASVLVAAGVFHGATAGYPTILSFGLQALLVHFSYVLWRRRISARGVGAVLLGSGFGLVLGGPAIAHAWRGIGLSDRAEGLPIDLVMAPAGSLPLASLWDLFWPFRAQALAGTDISMDRFHALLLTTALLSAGFFLWRSRAFRQRYAVRFVSLWVLAGLAVVLAAGDQLGPVRRLLAESSVIYRLGRFPGAEHQPVALFLLILASAYVFEAVTRERPRLRRLLLLLACLELGALYAATMPVRLTLARHGSLLGQPLARLEAVMGPGDRALLDRPRQCDPIPEVQYLEVFSRPEHSWWGYSAMRLQRYEQERGAVRELLCGGGRLFSWPAGTVVDYELIRYEPGRIELEINRASDIAGRELVWAETTDGYWHLTINERPVLVEPGPAELRTFEIPADIEAPARLRMVYQGPLSRLFRH